MVTRPKACDFADEAAKHHAMEHGTARKSAAE
jgi:hypothetical protein